MPHVCEFIVSPVGLDRCLPLPWRPSDTIGEVKALASEELEVEFQYLTFASRQLEGGRTLEYYSIMPGDVVFAHPLPMQPPTGPPEPPGKGKKGKGKDKMGKDKGKKEKGKGKNGKGNILRRPTSSSA